MRAASLLYGLPVPTRHKNRRTSMTSLEGSLWMQVEALLLEVLQNSMLLSFL